MEYLPTDRNLLEQKAPHLVKLLQTLNAPSNYECALSVLRAIARSLMVLDSPWISRAVFKLGSSLHAELDELIKTDVFSMVMYGSIGHDRMEESYRIWLSTPSTENLEKQPSIHITMCLLAGALIFRPSLISKETIVSVKKLISRESLSSRWRQPWDKFALTPVSNMLDIDHMTKQSSPHAPTVQLAKWLQEAAFVIEKISVPETFADWAKATSPFTKIISSENTTIPMATPQPIGDDEQVKLGGSLVKWHLSRSQKSGPARLAGIADWNVLTPSELHRTVGNLKVLLDQKNLESIPFVIAAFISLGTSLPIKLLLDVPTRNNDDLWIDIQSWTLRWSLNQLVQRQNQSEGEVRTQWVVLPLPVPDLRHLWPCPSLPTTIGDWLFPGTSHVAVLARYGHYLRSGDGDSPHRPYSARFSYSLGQAILEVTGDQISAAYGALDFQLLAPGEVHYLQIKHARLHEARQKTFAWLGLGEILPVQDVSEWIGSPRVPTTHAMMKTVRIMVNEMIELANDVRPRMQFENFIELFNRRTQLGLTLIITLIGHRGTRLEKLNLGNLLGDDKYLQIIDKDMGEAAYRLLPSLPVINDLLSAIWSDLNALLRRAKQAGHYGLVKSLERTLAADRALRPLAVMVKKNRKGNFGLRAVGRSDVTSVLATHNMPTNVGRQYLINALAEPLVPTVVRRALSGHGRLNGHAFHYAAGTTWEIAALALQKALNEIWEPAGISLPIPRLGAQGTAISPSRVGKVFHKKAKETGIVAFRQNDYKNVGRHSDRIIGGMAINLGRAKLLRESLANSFAPSLAPVALLLSLVLNDGIVCSFALEQLWQLLMRREAIPAGRTGIAFVKLQSGRTWPFLPTPVTHILWHAALREVSGNYVDRQAEVMAWVINQLPHVTFSVNPKQSWLEFLEIANTLNIVELAPYMVTARDATLGAASLSRGAFLRFISRRSLRSDLCIPMRSTSQPRTKEKTEFKFIAKELAKFGDINKRLGEDGKRRSIALEWLANYQSSIPFAEPMLEACCQWLANELSTTSRWRELISVSTLAEYLFDLSTYLHQRLEEHPLDWSVDEWEALESEIKRDFEVRHLEENLRGLHRFAHFWLHSGAQDAKSILDKRLTETQSLPPYSAASTFLWDEELKQLQALLVSECLPDSIEAACNRVYLQLCIEAPLRTSEADYLAISHLDDEHDFAVVFSSGYSHTKTENAFRRFNLSKNLADELRSLGRRLKGLDPKRRYFFFAGERPYSDPQFRRRKQLIAQGLRIITGDPQARRYLLRGLCISRILLPDVDKILESLLAFKAESPNYGKELGWNNILQCSLAAGHHSLTSLQHYIVVAVLLEWLLRQSANLSTWPTAQHARWAGVSSELFYQWLSRARKAQKNPSEVWNRLLSLSEIELPSIEHELAAERTALPETSMAQDTDTDMPNEDLALWHAGLVVCGYSAISAADITGLTLTKWHKKLPPGFSRESSEVQRIMKSFGLVLSQNISRETTTEPIALVLKSLTHSIREAATCDDEIVSAGKVITSFIPPDWILLLAPEKGGVSQTLISRLLREGLTVHIKSPLSSPSERFRFGVLPPGKSVSSPRISGAATATLKALLEIRLFNLESKFEGNHHGS